MKGRTKRPAIRLVLCPTNDKPRLLRQPKIDNLAYMYGKLSEAIEILITNHGDARNRVWVAAPKIFMVQAGGVPASLHEDIRWIHAKMTRYPANAVYKTALRATYQRTRNVTASRIAARVWKLYHAMQSELEGRSRR
jgi:hypothetical protein